jgi:hypothetical protein
MTLHIGLINQKAAPMIIINDDVSKVPAGVYLVEQQLHGQKPTLNSWWYNEADALGVVASLAAAGVEAWVIDPKVEE